MAGAEMKGSRLLARMVPASFVEIIARLAGYLVGIVNPREAYHAERIVRGYYWSIRLSGSDLLIGRDVQFEGDRIRLGKRIQLYDGGHYITGKYGWISIGDDTHIARMSIVSGPGGVDIGAGCAISSQVAIYSITADTYSRELRSGKTVRASVSIGSNVYIGVGAKIIPGVSIGDDAVVAAGAVVVRDVPAGCLAKGIPATCSPYDKNSDAMPGS